MATYKFETTRKRESTTCEGVTFYLFKMTEGRRLDLRKKNLAPNARVREILREQGEIEKAEESQKDMTKYAELNDEFDGIMIEMNGMSITWGVKKIEGLEVDGKPLDVADWQEFPSVLVEELVTAVRAESDLNGGEVKNSQSASPSGGATQPNPQLSIVQPVEKRDSGEDEIAASSSLKM